MCRINIVKTIVEHSKTEINKKDKYGVNAFWIANFHKQIEVKLSFINLKYRL